MVSKTLPVITISFLADRTNSRAYATVLRPSVTLYICGKTVRPTAKVTIDSL